MSSNVFPVSNNNNVLPIRQTTPNPFELKGELNQLGFSFLRKAEGFFFPNGPSTYPILDKDGRQISLPRVCYLFVVGVKNLGPQLPTTDTFAVRTSATTPQKIFEISGEQCNNGILDTGLVKTFSTGNNPGKLTVTNTEQCNPNSRVKIVFFYLTLE